MTASKVPSLDDMRAMSDAELLRLRTDLAYDRGVISSQLHVQTAPAEEWERRAKAAQSVREHGINAIKNILAERSAERSDEPDVPLQRWLEVMYGVIEAAQALVDADEQADDALWEALETALERYQDFSVRYALIDGVML